jgi:inorganic pyrophosphatase
VLPSELDVLVEVARWGFVKRHQDGRIALISPLPCPFNYGSIPNTIAADGDPEDVLVLGPRLAAGTRRRLPVLGRVRFVDAGRDDAKWVCGRGPLTVVDRHGIELFFTLYAQVKRVLNLRQAPGTATYYAGLET